MAKRTNRAGDGSDGEGLVAEPLSDLVDVLIRARLARRILTGMGLDPLPVTSGSKGIHLYSALDGYVRHFDVVIPTDAVAHIDERMAQAAMRMMETNMHAQLATGPEAVLRACRA